MPFGTMFDNEIVSAICQSVMPIGKRLPLEGRIL